MQLSTQINAHHEFLNTDTITSFVNSTLLDDFDDVHSYVGGLNQCLLRQTTCM